MNVHNRLAASALTFTSLVICSNATAFETTYSLDLTFDTNFSLGSVAASSVLLEDSYRFTENRYIGPVTWYDEDATPGLHPRGQHLLPLRAILA